MMKIDGNQPLNQSLSQSELSQVQKKSHKNDNAALNNTQKEGNGTNVKLTDEMKLVQEMTNMLKSQSSVDSKKVADIKIRIQNNTLDILANDGRQEAAADRIAEKLLGIDNSNHQ